MRKDMAHQQSGFTIIELMIATVVFSVILVMVSAGIIEINRIYYKGLTNSRTQEAARAILQDVAQAVQFNGGQIVGGPNVQCVGSRRYSFALHQKVQDSPIQHGLVADNPASCDPATPTNLTAALGADAAELLGPNMRLDKFSVGAPDANNLRRITVRVVTGDDDLLTDTNSDTHGDSCKSSRVGGQFCAVSELSTVVQQRVQ